jgi:FKBP-type peptidyl-prolyl cis-trans isomerase
MGLTLGLALLAGMAVAEESSVLEGEKEKRSYALGMDWGNRLKKDSLDVDADLVVQGLKDALAGRKTHLTEEEVKATLSALQSELRTRQIEATKKLAEDHKKQGEAFLAENKTREGVITLESGLQYKVLKAGEGPKPTAEDTVVCHYRGTLIDGTEFDSSHKRNQPATFAVNRVIKGWSQALQLMPVGSKWQLFIPASLAYGERGARRAIPPHATLVFEVELISIKEKSAAPSA